MSPIIRSGYRSPQDAADLKRVYNDRRWKAARAYVLQRDGGLCRFCGGPPKPGERLDVAHLATSTLELLRSGGDVFDAGGLVSAHRRCHRNYSAGLLPAPSR